MKKIELKAKQFASRYIANKMNGTKTALELYNTKDKTVANAISTENLQKPLFKKAIEDEMEKKGLNDEKVSKILDRNLSQGKHLPSSNSAIDMYFKLKGSYAPEKKASVNINITNPKAFKEELSSLLDEIKTLDEPTNP